MKLKGKKNQDDILKKILTRLIIESTRVNLLNL